VTLILGIDPGANGGIARIAGNALEVWPMPWIAGQGIQVPTVRFLFQTADHVFIEKAFVMPKQGIVSAATTIGEWKRIIGMAEGLSLPITIVPAKAWQKVMLAGMATSDKQARKSASIAVAQRLWPSVSLFPTERSRKPSDGMAEAALIAEYGRRMLAGATMLPADPGDRKGKA